MKSSADDSCKFVRFVAQIFVDFGGGDRVARVNFYPLKGREFTEKIAEQLRIKLSCEFES